MAAAEHRPEWVQPIVVDSTGTHLDTIKAVALASMRVYLETAEADLASWDTWLSGAFTKSVRRAKPALFEKLANPAVGIAARVEIAGSRALAYRPIRYADLPRELSRLQVSGTDFTRLTSDPLPDRLTAQSPVAVVVSEDLTTGKAAAQAAHALFAWVLDARPRARAAWLAQPAATSVTLASPDRVKVLSGGRGAVPIHDNGYTEVEPGTLTAVAVPSLTWVHP